MRKPHPTDHRAEDYERIVALLHQMRIEMSDLSDRIATLTQAVADNTTATDAAVAKIGSGTPSDAADVAAAVTALDAANNQIATNTASLNNAQPPA